MSLIKDTRVEGITIKFPYSNKWYNGKEHRNYAVRGKEKNWGKKGEEKMLYINMHYLDLVVLLVAQREGLIL